MTKGAIVTDRPFYRSGDLVKGKVAIHLDTKPAPFKLGLTCTGTTDLSFPYNKVIGMIPVVKMIGNPPTAQTHLQPVFEKAEATESKELFHLEAEQSLSPRSDQTDILVPFEFRLPEDLPASFGLVPDGKENPGASACTSYKLAARLEFPEEHVTFSEDLLLGQIAKSAQAETTKPVSLFHCISQGHLSCTLRLNKDFYAPGESIALHLFLGSEKLTATFDRIHVSLAQTLILKAAGQTHKANRSIFKYKFDGMKDIRREMVLQLPQEMETSTTGDHIDSSYMLRVKFKRRIGTDIIFESPVQIQMVPSSPEKRSLQGYELMPLNLLLLK